MTLETLLAKLNSLDINKLYLDQVFEMSEVILNMQKQQLNDENVDSEGTKTPLYAESTIQYKLDKVESTPDPLIGTGATGSGSTNYRYSLFDFGDFYGNMYLIFHQDGFSIYSKDIKTQQILSLPKLKEYDVFGLTQKNKDILANLLLDKVAEELRNRLLT